MPRRIVRTKSSSLVSPSTADDVPVTTRRRTAAETDLWLSAWECAFDLKHPDVVTKLRNTLLRA